MAKRSRAAHDSAADIGIIPQPVDPERRERCRTDLHAFLVEYFPETTGLAPFGPAQRRAIKRIERAILKGGRFLNLFPRGFAKSTISENAMIWAALYGHRRYVVFFGAGAADAQEAIGSIKKELTGNDQLAADFPEVVVPCRALEGKSQRCASQTHRPGNLEGAGVPARDENRLTGISWTAETIVLPTILVPDGWGKPGASLDWSKLRPAPAAGAIVRTKGLMAASRGMRFKRPDGVQARPDFAVVDDPQTDESAISPVQVEKRLNTIRRSILRLGGHGRAVACVMNATIIADGDLPDTLADPDRHPEWEVERIKMVVKLPPPDIIETYWLGEYARLRRTYDRSKPGDREKAVAASTRYYQANRAAMDADAVVAWEGIPLEDGEISALQHALNIWIDDGEDVFASECQNEPKRLVTAGVSVLNEKDLANRTNGFDVGIVPEARQHIVAHIDVHDSLLYWCVAAVNDDFTGDVIRYGVFPEQPNPNFTLRSAKRTLQARYGINSSDPKGSEAAILEGLIELINEISGTVWKTVNGVEFKLSRGLVDTGYKPEQVAAAIRRSEHPELWLGSRGVGIGPAERPMTEYDTAPTRVFRCGPDRKAPRWYIPAQKAHGIRIVRFDANYWKDSTHARFTTPNGSPGEWRLFGNHRTNHRLYAGHLTAQEPVPTTAKGRTVNQWKLRPNREDHWLDTTVGCLVAASLDGCRLDAAPVTPPRPKARRKLSDLRKRR